MQAPTRKYLFRKRSISLIESGRYGLQTVEPHSNTKRTREKYNILKQLGILNSEQLRHITLNTQRS